MYCIFLNNLIKINSNRIYFLIFAFLTFIFCLYILIQKWPNNNNIIFKNILLENTTNYLNECIEEEENNKKWSLQCCGEQMSISFNVETNNKLTENTISGKRFDCKHLQILQKYKLGDKYKIEQKIQLIKPGDKKFVIVTAATNDYWPTLRKLFVILKQQFGCSQKIIGYDLESISEDKNMMEEINSVCNLEWRKYNWSIMPNNVHSPKAYAWKLYEIYSQYDTFMWADTSFTIDGIKSLDPIFDSIESGIIAEAVFPSNAGHSIHGATNLRTFSYLPIITDWTKIENNKWDVEMYESNYIIFHKSEFTRKLLKWALLCAATKECIEPKGSELFCDDELLYTEIGTCHRPDQSALAIITVDLEYQRSLLDEKFIPHFHTEHPRKYSKHDIRRREELDGNVNFKKEVACCKLPST